jgi:drug/metabolite transporter (DMT)-like permease
MSRRGWGAFAAVSVVWGVPYLFIRIAVDDGLAPGFIAWSRVAVAAALLLPLAARTGALRGLRHRLGALVAFAIAEVAVPFPLIALGERYVSSSLAAILIAALPLAIALLAFGFDVSERRRGLPLAGLLIGLVGVTALVGIDLSGSTNELVGAGCLMIATLGYAVGALIVKRRLADVEPLGPVAAAMGIGTLILLPAAAISAPTAAPSAAATASLGILGVACTALAFLLYFALIARVGAGRASLIAYINPVIAVALGVALLGENLGPGGLGGIVLILVGCWLANGSALPRLGFPRPPKLAALRLARFRGPSQPAHEELT